MNNKNLLLIADSGATKTDWSIVEQGQVVHHFQTKGISPIFQSEEEIATAIKNDVFPQTGEIGFGRIRFYGSGCIPEKTNNVKRAIRQSFAIDDIEVYSDLTAAAHALCGHDSGIACILGTGSNSCQWNGEEVVKQVSPLGFILGDEGSGASLGKQLVADALKNQLSPGLKEKLLNQYDLSPSQIIDRVYRQPFPSRFLASFSPFLLENIDDNTIYQIVEKGFTDFFDRNVMQYDYRENSVNFVGSIAYYLSDLLFQIAEIRGISIGKIEKSPMQGLIEYYK